jgi:hypothetical protein
MNLQQIRSWSSLRDKVVAPWWRRSSHADEADVEIGQTLIILRPAELKRVLGEESLVVCGSSRGGTSIIAYVLLRLGYYLGDRLGGFNHEDEEIVAAIERPRQMAAIIESRNRRLKRWGFKAPDAIHRIDWLAKSLRNPVFLVVFRNPVAIARTIMTREANFCSRSDDLSRAIHHGLRYMLSGTRVLTTRTPSILIDVDAARGAPEQLVRELASLFTPDVSAETIAAVGRDIGVAGYKVLDGCPAGID